MLYSYHCKQLKSVSASQQLQLYQVAGLYLVNVGAPRVNNYVRVSQGHIPKHFSNFVQAIVSSVDVMRSHPQSSEI